MTAGPVSADVYTDFSHLASLKTKARAGSPETLDKVAGHFESVFMQMILKSMREASFGGGILDSDQSDFYRDLYDKQLSIHLTHGSGAGLAELISRQLGKTQDPPDQARKLDDYRAHPVQSIRWIDPPKKVEEHIEKSWLPHALSEAKPSSEPGFRSQNEFIEALRPHAIRAGRQLGVHPGVLLAQAALESGWGKKAIRQADGEKSYNLFGIKADSHWQGPSTAASTLEYEGGIFQPQRAKFRSYQGYADSFQDYVEFIQSNPRYVEALRSAEDPRKYMEVLQKAGYATDPDYATKVMSIFDQRGFAEHEVKSA